jgi:hypothetical protein
MFLQMKPTAPTPLTKGNYDDAGSPQRRRGAREAVEGGLARIVAD